MRNAGDPPPVPVSGTEVIDFGRFRLLPASRLILKAGVPMHMGDRALDILIALVRRAGRVVTKEELFAIVWPETVVEESNLRVNVAALRKSLGDGVDGARFIVSVPGRGYSFVGTITRSPGDGGELPSSATPEPRQSKVPSTLTRLFGRDRDVARIVEDLLQKRLITIVGTGGIGKTSVALKVAELAGSRFGSGVLILDLAPLPNADLVPIHLASALRISAGDLDPLGSIVRALQSRHMLIVLDNCDQVLAAIGKVAEHVLQWAPNAHFLATSREPLGALGEFVYRLQPLDVPPATRVITAELALRSSAVQLLRERVNESGSAFEVTDADAPAVAGLCTRLDGLPLAIELAAARVALFGLHAVVDRLEQRFSLLTTGRRTAAKRHQTLAGLIDWSYDILPEDERYVWRQLSIFSGSFTLDAATAVAQGTECKDFSLLESLGGLVQKSLLSMDTRGTEVRYRLLETLRLYAQNKLVADGELHAASERHALYFKALARSSGGSWAETPSREWLVQHGDDIGDIRAALEWGFSPGGNALLAVQLTVTSVSVWFKLLLVPEVRGYLERAVRVAEHLPGLDPVLEMQLHIALGHSIFHTSGPGSKVSESFDRALALAERHADVDVQIRIIRAIFGNHATWGEYGPMMLSVAKMREACAKSSNPYAPTFYDRIAALAFHLIGEQDKAHGHSIAAINHPAWNSSKRDPDIFTLNYRILGRSHYVRILWMQGRGKTALQSIESTIEEAMRADLPYELGYFLLFAACPVAFWSANLPAARAYLARVPTFVADMQQGRLMEFARLYERFIEIQEAGDDVAQLGRAALLETPTLTDFQAQTLVAMDWRLLTPRALAHVQREVNWSTAEVLRARGEKLLAEAEPGSATEAEHLFTRAIEISRQQGALAWELRATLSLARLSKQTARSSEVMSVLAALCKRFTDGFEFPDVVEARALIDANSAHRRTPKRISKP